MAYSKKVVYSQIILPDGKIQVQRDDQVWEDELFIAHYYHRHVVSPGEDVSNEDQRTKNIAGIVHTPKVIADFKEAEREAIRQLFP